MNKYNQLREEIIKANKDIVRLTIGCVVETERIDFCGKQLKQKWTLGHYDSEGGCWRCEDNEAIEKQEIIKIIGRPISLEDCLIAIDEKIGHNTQYNGIRNDGHFLIDFGEKTAWTDDDKPIKWTMGKPLHQQKQETIDFLWDLICK